MGWDSCKLGISGFHMIVFMWKGYRATARFNEAPAIPLLTADRWCHERSGPRQSNGIAASVYAAGRRRRVPTLSSSKA